jgi:3-oxoacyl-[acyl-carrier-protein] synthase II
VVSAAGVGVDALWEALLEGRSCVAPITLFDASEFPCTIAGGIEDFSARKFVPKHYRKAVKVMARDIELAVAAADLAFRDSGIVTRGIDADNMTIDPKRLGCNIGAGLICTDLDELGAAVNTAVSDGKFDQRAWGASGMNNLTPLWLLKYLPNMLSCHVTIIHGAEGPSNCITCGDASALLSIGESTRLIQQGRADAVIAGGAESKVNPMGLLRQSLLARLCESSNDSPATACRPFDAEHCGTIIGEGGGLAILEDMDRAAQRGVSVYAEVVGFGAACDPGGMDVRTPNAGNLHLAIDKALKDAGITPEQVGLIVAHGTGVAAEDAAESAAWQSVLGQRAVEVPAVAVTGAIGSLFAGAGGASVAIAAKALREGLVPPTVNFDRSSDGCCLNLQRQPLEAGIEYALCGSFGTGGQSAAMVLRKVQ